MKILKFLLLFALLNSCSPQKRIYGLYGKCGNQYFYCRQIELKPDQTFEYFIFYDVGGGTVLKGKWEQVSADSIKLNTHKQPKIPNTRYVGRINPENTDSLKIRIKDSEGPLYAAVIQINDENYAKSSDTDGLAIFKKKEVKTITYNYLLREETIEIDNPNYNEILITVKDLNLSAAPEYLTDEIITVNNGKLTLNENQILKKTSSKNKKWK